CASDDENSSQGGSETAGDRPVYNFEEMMDKADLIAFVTVDEIKDKDQDNVDAKIAKLKIDDVVYSKNENTEETIELDQSEKFVESDKSYLLFLNKEGDFYYETDGNSLIQE